MHPRNLSLALGSASVPPIDVATAYASFANQGYQVKPYFIERIEDSLGKVLYQAQPTTVCPNCDYIRHTDEVDLDQSEDTQTYRYAVVRSRYYYSLPSSLI